MEKLLTRKEFEERVFARDKNKCVFCDLPAKDAHHILDRKLFPDNGYYLSNGASVCADHHMKCETTEISVEQVRAACGITTKILPPQLFEDSVYDKWGNIILPSGLRTKGEMFFHENVQKVLKPVMDQFTHLMKYPRTPHAPWSQGVGSDDRTLKSMEHFHGKRVVVTEKMDGENTTMYREDIHARSLDGRSNFTRDWVKQFHAGFKHDIPEWWRVCGENMWAKHSIYYDNLPSLFLGFSIWNERNVCLSWNDTIEYFQLLGIEPVPVLYDGIYDEALIMKLFPESKFDVMEGYTIRLADAFAYEDFAKSIAKNVRRNHVQTDDHWLYGGNITPNKMKAKE